MHIVDVTVLMWQERVIMVVRQSVIELVRPIGLDMCNSHQGIRTSYSWVAVISAKNHKRQHRKRQSVTAK